MTTYRDIYLEAARKIAEGESTYSCVAITSANIKLQGPPDARKLYEYCMDLDENPGAFWHGDDELAHKEHRVLALCLMATVCRRQNKNGGINL